jgi:phospholipid/cholesterol/gamma-HCH transport system permease protein
VTAIGLYSVSSSVFVSAVRDGITTDDLIGGMVKPIVFAFIIGSVACRQGLSTEGGTVGVGRSTTRAVVMASIVVIIADYFLAKALQVILGSA